MTSQAPNPQNQSRRTGSLCEPSYRNEDTPSLERVDRVHKRRGVGGGHEQWHWESPEAQGHSRAPVGPSQHGRPLLSGTCRWVRRIDSGGVISTNACSGG